MTHKAPVVRPLTTQDRPLIERVTYIAGYDRDPHPPTLEEMLERGDSLRYHALWGMAGSDIGFALELDGQAVGAGWSREFTKKTIVHANDRIVPELVLGMEVEARGQRYGELILGAVIEENRQRGVPMVSLFTDVDNPRARNLYDRMGFTPAFDLVHPKHGVLGTAMTLQLGKETPRIRIGAHYKEFASAPDLADRQ